MALSFSSDADRKTVGFDPGWRLSFYEESESGDIDRISDPKEIKRAHHNASIHLVRSTSFRGATFEVTVAGLTDDDFADLVGRPYVEIRLGWRDIAEGGGLAALGSAIASMFTETEGTLYPVMIGRIREVTRSAGRFLYNTTFSGVDMAYHALDVKCPESDELMGGLPAPEVIDAFAGNEVNTASHLGGDPATITSPPRVDPEKTYVETIRRLLRRFQRDGDDRSIPAFTRLDIDEGTPFETLHIGTAVSALGGPHTLAGSSGLAEARPVLDSRPTGDPFAVPAADELTYDVISLGRAEIQPGDQVTLEIDEFTAGGALGGLTSMAKAVGSELGLPTGTDAPFDVVSVEHRLGTETGFVTTMRVSPHRADGTRPDTEEGESELTEDQRAANALAMRNRAVEGLFAEVGFINRQSAAGGPYEGDTWDRQRRGVEEGLGTENSELRDRAVASPPRAEPLTLTNLPYLTPFAWGKAGLVVPHYPGTRVLDLHYRGDAYHSIVAGCLWSDGQEPQDAQDGDWWLNLPTGVSAADAGDPEEVDYPEGPASHDLIDRDGRRAIHVAGFRITVGESLMKDVGVRPDEPPAGEIEIKHENSNAVIRIDSNGDIEIGTDGDLTLRANKITAEVGDRFEVT